MAECDANAISHIPLRAHSMNIRVLLAATAAAGRTFASAALPDAWPQFASLSPRNFLRKQAGIIMRKKLAMAFLSLIVLGGASTMLAGCNTVEGAGKDVAHAGKEVSEEANEHK